MPGLAIENTKRPQSFRIPTNWDDVIFSEPISLNSLDISYRHIWSLATRHPIVFSCKLSCSHSTRLNGMPATETSTYSNQLSPTSTFQTWHRASFMKHDAMSWKIALKKFKRLRFLKWLDLWTFYLTSPPSSAAKIPNRLQDFWMQSKTWSSLISTKLHKFQS